MNVISFLPNPSYMNERQIFGATLSINSAISFPIRQTFRSSIVFGRTEFSRKDYHDIISLK